MDAAFLDTLAAAYSETADFDAAVKWQKKAVQLAGAESQKGMKSRLKRYEEKKPHRDFGSRLDYAMARRAFRTELVRQGVITYESAHAKANFPHQIEAPS